MALSGIRSAEDRATRLVVTHAGFVSALRKGNQRYEIRKGGEPLGEVHKLKNWFPNAFGKPDRNEETGPPCATRQAAIEWLVENTLQTPAINAKGAA